MLTAKREAFAQLLATSPISQVDAYRHTHDVSPDGSPATHYEEASRIAAIPEVAARIQQLKAIAQAKVVAKHSWTLDRVVTQAEKHLEIALSGGFKGVPAANGALEIIGRATGILSDKARETPQVPITRVVIVLNQGPDPKGRPIITEAAYEVLPAATNDDEKAA